MWIIKLAANECKGWDYDFTTEFYAAPGITLSFFNPLEKIDFPNLPDKYKEIEIYNCSGFYELVQSFRLNGMLALHEVFEKMDANKELENLNYKNDFMFIINEHDSSSVYPLLIKEKK